MIGNNFAESNKKMTIDLCYELNLQVVITFALRKVLSLGLKLPDTLTAKLV